LAAFGGQHAGGDSRRFAAMGGANYPEANVLPCKRLGQGSRLVLTAVVHHQHFVWVLLSGQVAGHFVQRSRLDIRHLVVSRNDNGKKRSHDRTCLLKKFIEASASK
jgi:hypothetical protein